MPVIEDSTSRYAAQRYYEEALGTLKDAAFICNERDYFGVNALIRNALQCLEAIAVVCKLYEKTEERMPEADAKEPQVTIDEYPPKPKLEPENSRTVCSQYFKENEDESTP